MVRLKPFLRTFLWVLLLLTLFACQAQGGSEEQAPRFTPTVSGTDYELVTMPLYSSVDSHQSQEIRVWVRKQGMPQSNVQPVLALTSPDGNTHPYVFPPTDGNGETHMTIFPIVASNGMLVPYEVCLYVPLLDEKCVQDSYLIWNE